MADTDTITPFEADAGTQHRPVLIKGDTWPIPILLLHLKPIQTLYKVRYLADTDTYSMLCNNIYYTFYTACQIISHINFRKIVC